MHEDYNGLYLPQGSVISDESYDKWNGIHLRKRNISLIFTAHLAK